MHLKLDELIRALSGARNHLVDLEKLPEEELEVLAAQFAVLQKRARKEALKIDRKAATVLPQDNAAELANMVGK